MRKCVQTRLASAFYSALKQDCVHIWQIQHVNDTTGIITVTRPIIPDCCNDFDIDITSRNEIIACYLGIPADDVAFCISPYGKPSVDTTSNDIPIEFNVSHSRDMELIALSCVTPIGIDVERIRPVISLWKIAYKYFTKNEQDFISSQPTCEAQLKGFFRCWTRKEAFVKAIGLGFQTTLNSYETHPEIQGTANIDNVDEGMATGWCVSDIDVTPDYIAAFSIMSRGRFLL